MSADPTVPLPPAPVAPMQRPGDEATLPLGPIAPQPLQLQPIPVPPVPQRPVPERWAGRVAVAGAKAPGQAPAPPTAPTQPMARYQDTALAPRQRPVPPPPRPSRHRGRRFFGAMLALLLILAVPVVSAYVAYKLTSGDNPFEWPPTMDLSRVF